MRYPILLLALAPLVVVAASCVGDDAASPAGALDAGGGGNDAGGLTDTGGGGNDAGGGDAGNAGDGGDAAIPPADIDGDVIDSWGRPQAAATVRVGTTKVTTDGTGHFHFTLVPGTYDLDVLATSTSGGKGVTSFRGLTTRTPRVNVDGSSDVRTASLGGTVFNTAAALGTNEHLRISDMESAGGFVQPQISTDQTSTFSGTGVWVGPATQTLTYWALRYTTTGNADQPITGFSQYFRATHQETAGVPNNAVTVSMVAATTGTVTGTVTNIPATAGTATVGTSVKLTSDPFGYYAAGKIGVTGAFSVIAPSANGLVVNVGAAASSSVGSVQESHAVWKANQATSATGIALSFGTAPAAMSPADAATGVKNDTSFGWTPGSPAGVYKLSIRCGSGATQYEATVLTTATSAKFADGTDLGAGWPSTVSCTWSVTLYQQITTVDAVMVANGRNKVDKSNGPVDGAYVEVRGYALTTL